MVHYRQVSRQVRGEALSARVIKFNSNQRGNIRSLPLHWSQKEIETADKYSVFEYFLKPTYDFLLEILAQGESFSILEPEWVRLELVEYSRNICEMKNGCLSIARGNDGNKKK